MVCGKARWNAVAMVDAMNTDGAEDGTKKMSFHACRQRRSACWDRSRKAMLNERTTPNRPDGAISVEYSHTRGTMVLDAFTIDRELSCLFASFFRI